MSVIAIANIDKHFILSETEVSQANIYDIYIGIFVFIILFCGYMQQVKARTKVRLHKLTSDVYGSL